jgi:hypothetical protein
MNEIKKLKEWGLKLKKKMTIMDFTCQEREKEEKKETTADDNPTTRHRHMSYYVEERTRWHIKKDDKMSGLTTG